MICFILTLWALLLVFSGCIEITQRVRNAPQEYKNYAYISTFGQVYSFSFPWLENKGRYYNDTRYIHIDSIEYYKEQEYFKAKEFLEKLD